MPWVILLAEFLVLFLTSKFIFNSFFAIAFAVFKNRRVASFLVSYFFFPGVLVHEVSHFLMAKVLGVKTHGMEFLPVLNGTSLKMGSVSIEKTDLLRSLLIGVAPLFVGVGLLVLSLSQIVKTFSYSDIFSSGLSIGLALIAGYIVFVVTNTMFSSKKDVEGLVEVLIIVGLILGVIYFIGKFPYEAVLSLLQNPKTVEVITKIDFALLFPVAINFAVVFLAYPLVRKIGFTKLE